MVRVIGLPVVQRDAWGLCVPTGVDGVGDLGQSPLNSASLPDFVNTEQPIIRG